MAYRTNDSGRTSADLRQLQQMPLSKKVVMTKQRIRQWVEHYGKDNVYVSFSGGKDSTVLLHIAREMYPDIHAVYIDTSLEYPEVRQFALSQENIEVLKPKLNFRETVVRYGYPIFSKEICETVYGARRWLTALREKYDNSTDRQADRQTDESLLTSGTVGSVKPSVAVSTHRKSTESAVLKHSKDIADALGMSRRGSDKTSQEYLDLKKGKVPKRYLTEESSSATIERTNERTNERMPEWYRAMDLLGVERRYLTSEKRQESTESNRQDAVQIRSTTNIRNYRDTSATVWNRETSNLEIGGAVTEISPAELYQMIRTGDIPEPIRLQMMEGNFKNPNATKSIYNKEKWQFMLFAPFEISNKCCSVMKKAPAHKYGKDTGRYPMTAEMASESKLRAQKWMDNGCNGFDMKSPKSMPMAFWLEQDVLAYIKLNNIEIPSVYGDIVAEYQGEDNMDGQMSIADYSEFGVFDLERPLLTTTGCARTGCIACGFGIHLEKPPCNRLYAIEELSNPKVLDWFLRGGNFDPEDGLWKPDNRGLGFWFVYEWVNQNGNLRKPLEFPHRQEYIEKYHTELTDKYLYEGLKYRT